MDFVGNWELKDYLAIWGACLSSALGGIKLFELWRDRHRIDVSYSFTSDANEGNTVIIRNLSNRQIIVTYWELFAAFDAKGKRDLDMLSYSDFDCGDLPIAANTSHSLNFCEANFFSTSHSFLKGRNIYIKLCIAGKSPTTHLVYP